MLEGAQLRSIQGDLKWNIRDPIDLVVKELIS
jgi:hypothetical protein